MEGISYPIKSIRDKQKSSQGKVEHRGTSWGRRTRIEVVTIEEQPYE